MAKGLTIVAVPPGGQVTQIGTDRRRGVWAEDVSWDHTLPDHGARQAQFTLKRKPEQEWDDLQPFTPIIIYKGGSVGFTGRIQQTPTIRGRQNQITVICEGWPASMKDDAVEKWFVHNDLTAWRDARSYSQAPLATYTSAYQVDTGGIPMIRVSNGTTVPLGAAGGITLDAGPYNTIKRVVLSVIGGGHAGFALRWLAGDTPAAATEFGVASGPPIVTAATPASFSVTTPRRYVTLYMDVNALTNVALDTAWVQLLNIICFTDTAYEAGNVSILKASQIIPAVLPLAPAVSQATTGISPTTFSYPHFAGPLASVWDYVDAANGGHSYQWFLRDDAAGGKPLMIFRPVPSSPLLVANVGAGIEFDDASRNDGSEVYNRVVVEYTDAAGNTAREERTTAGLANAFADPDITFDTASALSAGPNPGFETAGGPPASGWSILIGGTITRDTGVFDTGAASGLVSSSAGGQFLGVYSMPGLVPGKSYVLQYRVRAHAAWLAGTMFLGGDSFTNAIGAAFTTRRTLPFTCPSTGIVTLTPTGSALTPSANICYLDNLQLFEARPTIIDRQGFTRTKVLTTSARLTAPYADQLGDVFLQAHRFIPLRGTLTIQGAALRTLSGDVPIPAHLIGGRYLGEAVLINETDPDLGSIGRLGIIASAAYDDKTDTCTAAIDVTKDFTDTLMARLAVFS